MEKDKDGQVQVMEDALKMSVSQIFRRNGNKYAFVSFSDDKRTAEGKIPDCRITSRQGFTLDEAAQLEEYLRKEIDTLWQMAKGINAMDAFLKG